MSQPQPQQYYSWNDPIKSDANQDAYRQMRQIASKIENEITSIDNIVLKNEQHHKYRDEIIELFKGMYRHYTFTACEHNRILVEGKKKIQQLSFNKK